MLIKNQFLDLIMYMSSKKRSNNVHKNTLKDALKMHSLLCELVTKTNADTKLFLEKNINCILVLFISK